MCGLILTLSGSSLYFLFAYGLALLRTHCDLSVPAVPFRVCHAAAPCTLPHPSRGNRFPSPP